MSVYLIGNSMTESIDNTTKIVSSEDISNKKFEYGHLSNHRVNIALTGGPGSGKGSFGGALINELKSNPNNVIILVAETARDVLNDLQEKQLRGKISNEELQALMSEETDRRMALTDELISTFYDKNIFVITDRDPLNSPIYSCFFPSYDRKSETLDEATFHDNFNNYPNIREITGQVSDFYDLCFLLAPVRHEVNYACANPKVEGAPIDETRRSSYKEAKMKHRAEQIAQEIVYKDDGRLINVENTDKANGTGRKETILKRVLGQLPKVNNTMTQKHQNSYKTT